VAGHDQRTLLGLQRPRELTDAGQGRCRRSRQHGGTECVRPSSAPMNGLSGRASMRRQRSQIGVGLRAKGVHHKVEHVARTCFPVAVEIDPP
jgi:hypothetical protein